MLEVRKVLLAKLESTYNTDPTPTASADAIQVENLKYAFTNQKMGDRPEVSPGLHTFQQIYGQSLMQLTFDMEVKGAGSAYSASVLPEIHVPLRICGIGAAIVTTVGAETVTYTPAESSHASATFYLYHDGIRYIITGCRGDCKVKIATAEKVVMSFTITGHWNAKADVALATPTLDTHAPPVARGQSFAIGGYSAVIATLEFGFNNKLAMPPSINATDGFDEIVITGRDVSGSFDPTLALVATKDFDALWRAGTTGALATGAIGSTQYNKVTFSMPVVYARDIGFSDRDGVSVVNYSFGAAISAGSDEVTILFN